MERMKSFHNDQICRLCLSSEGTINIFSQTGTSASCAEKVMFCTRVTIKYTDELPKMICKFCFQQLDVAYQFRVQVINSDYKLRKAIKDLENLNASEIFSNEIIEITLHNPEEKKEIEAHSEKTTNEEKSCNNTDSTVAYDTEGEARIGIIKLGEDLKDNQNLIKNLMCEHCGKKFRKRHQLCVHTRIHTKEKPFLCDVCKKSFVLSHHLKAHLRIHASDPQERKPFKCTYCNKMFSENSSLSRHIKIHENVKLFMCKFCNKKFITLADVRKHLVRHSGLKPYQCKLCDKKYSNPSNLSKHKKKHCAI
ncbi:Protein glass [Pseudolycoriella hygida]|uniref:Protein glass n=1 Tax=Pseudolycoriella hygida TaxID=35572 RepID=A0A9Q0S4V3_9DIPT|nr:Protein glass [Pseudolycoriella hygida]